MTTAEKKIKIIDNFDPNNPGVAGNIFGLPFDQEVSEIILIPVPWDVTVSYSEGTHQGPAAILNASPQIDYYLPDHPEAWKKGIFMLPINNDWQETNHKLRPLAKNYIEALEAGANINPFVPDLQRINQACEHLHKQVKESALVLLNEGKTVGVVGGEHSVPLGLMQALAEKGEFGILQIDAHADLREAYEGFTYSHASIMYNALQIPQLKKIVQVGIRDICETEVALANIEQVDIFYDQKIKEQQFYGKQWAEICEEIVAALPRRVYVSFDIDGLQPWLCPNTGTPVPDGLTFSEAVFLLKLIKKSGRSIIGFDLCEVSPGQDEWDANVGARVLYQLCAIAGN
ncbi:MAG: agmatinase family protein [Cyclobacteriaceae bacterium]